MDVLWPTTPPNIVSDLSIATGLHACSSSGTSAGAKSDYRILGVLRPGGHLGLPGLFISSFWAVAAHAVLLRNQCHWGVLVPWAVCLTCQEVWAGSLCHLESIWNPGSRVSQHNIILRLDGQCFFALTTSGFHVGASWCLFLRCGCYLSNYELVNCLFLLLLSAY